MEIGLYSPHFRIHLRKVNRFLSPFDVINKNHSYFLLLHNFGIKYKTFETTILRLVYNWKQRISKEPRVV